MTTPPTQLFPLPALFTPETAEEFMTTELEVANTLGLRTTSWQPGDPSRTVLAVMANMFALQDVDISILAQGGFLDYAATGTVTYTDPVSGTEITVYVTPDPSDPSQNPTGALGILDVLADSLYDVRRTLNTFAGGDAALVNTSVSTYGPFAAGLFHVAQPSAVGSPTYHNTTTLSIPPSPLAGTSVFDASNTTPIVVTTSTNHGLSTGTVVFIAGVGGNTNANGYWTITVTGLTTFELDDSAGNSGYTSGGTVRVPTVATFEADTAGSASDATDPGVVTQLVTTLIGVTVYNLDPWLGSDIQSNVELAATCRLKLQSLSPNGPRGAYEYFTKQSQILAPLLDPPMAVSSAITRALVQPDPYTGMVVTTIANQAGAPSNSDVLATDAVIQAYCVPDAVTAITQAAAENTMAVIINLWVPSAYQTTVVPVAQVAAQTYFHLLAIGGVTDPGEAPPNVNVVPYNRILGAVVAAAQANKIPVQQITGTLDGGTANVQLLLTPVPEVAVLTPSTPTVNVTPV